MILEISRRDSFILPLELRVLNGMKYCIFLRWTTTNHWCDYESQGAHELLLIHFNWVDLVADARHKMANEILKGDFHFSEYFTRLDYYVIEKYQIHSLKANDN